MGFKFSVLPEGFLVHNPHAESDTKKAWKDVATNLRSGMDELYAQFLKEVGEKFDGRVGPIVETCEVPESAKKDEPTKEKSFLSNLAIASL